MSARLISITMFLWLLTMAAAQLAAQCPASGHPLSETELIGLVRTGAPARVEQLVAGCGIAFEPTADALARLHSAGASADILDAVRASKDPDATLWESIMNSQDPKVFADYLSRYPHGQFAEAARQKYRALVELAIRADMERLLDARQWDAADEKIQDLLRSVSEDDDIRTWRQRVTEGRAADERTAEQSAWESVRDSQEQGRLRQFLRDYPSGQHAAAAQKRLDDLIAAALKPPPPAPVLTAPRAIAPSPPRPATAKVNAKDGLTYSWIPPGAFTMGCSSGDAQCIAVEKPAHAVTITKGFWLGQTPVTQRAFERLMAQNPSRAKGPDLPVTVDWGLAKAYCDAAGGRLPTEAEWEYAARAGSAAVRYGDVDGIAWYSANSGGQAHDVGKKLANAFGLYDMLGNVSQWVADWFGPYQAAAQSDPSGPATGQWRTKRGAPATYDAGDVRVSFRNSALPGGLFGFRCAVE